jgi:predicted 3-demethylubiquinone-9 3-methyltransferase (glyoxalase superfamily)
MALLSNKDNSSLSNSVFEVKRQKILALDRDGEYVPACTRNVFLKYYADADAQQPHYWSEKDKDSYFKAIHKMLNPYFECTA